MSTTIPIFRIFDLAKATEFYIGWLGFQKNREHRFDENAPIYMEVQLRDIRIHLSEHHGDCSPGAHVTIEDFENIEIFHQMLLDKNYKYNRPGLDVAFWDANIKVAEVIDPFNNRILFTGRANLFKET